MHKPSVIRVILKDVIDFLIIFIITILLTFMIYKIVPSFTEVKLSLYFVEQLVEVFFINPKLLLWLLSLSFFVTLLYFLLCIMRYQNTIGGKICRLKLVDRKAQKSAELRHALLMAMGAYLGFLSFLVGPLSAWWLHKEHLGWSERIASLVLVKEDL